jgi:hypothetical protein
MGALIPVGSGPDKEIVDRLNSLFSGANLTTLRHHDQVEKLFDGHHRLGRVAFRLGAYPSADYSPGDPDAKRKWFYFLHHELPQETQDAIKRILSDAMTRSSIRAVEFSVEENSVASHPHLFPSNREQLTAYLNQARNAYLVHLVVPAPMSGNVEDPPADQDPGETPITWAMLRLRRPRFATAGGKRKPPRKKAPKKAPKKKKAAKKSRR